jgi:hypothetical protein
VIGNTYADQVLYEERPNGKKVPRCILVDRDPESIDSIFFAGKQKDLFSLDYSVSGKQDSSNIYYCGAIEREFKSTIIDVLRFAIERCDSFLSFNLLHSISGGTGSGLAADCFYQLKNDFGKKLLVTQTVHPSLRNTGEDTIVASYNAVHAMSHLVDDSDLSVLYQNQALYAYCSRTLKIEQPSLIDANRLIA